MCPNALHMSGSPAGPRSLSRARVDQLQAGPMVANVVVLLEMSVTAVKSPAKANKEL